LYLKLIRTSQFPLRNSRLISKEEWGTLTAAKTMLLHRKMAGEMKGRSLQNAICYPLLFPL